MTKAIRTIVVGVDGSSNSKIALEWAITLARSLSAEVIAVHAVGLLAHLGSGPPVPAQTHLEELRRVFETEWCSSLTRSGIPHRMCCVDGAPAMALLEAVQRVDADLAVRRSSRQRRVHGAGNGWYQSSAGGALPVPSHGCAGTGPLTTLRRRIQRQSVSLRYEGLGSANSARS